MKNDLSVIDGGVVKEHNKLRIVSEEFHSLQLSLVIGMLFGQRSWHLSKRHRVVLTGIECQYQNSRCWGAIAVESFPAIRKFTHGHFQL